FHGRVDDQVKIRGFRIEPGEIEAALMAHPMVERAVVTVHDRSGDRRLVGYVVPAVEADGGLIDELRAYLRERLPEHMVPAVLMVIDEVAVTANGKIDKRALPAPDFAGTAAYRAP